MSPEPIDEGFDLFGYLSVLWRRKVIVILLTVVAVAAALTISFLTSPKYVSETKIQVKSTALNPVGSIPVVSTISIPTEAKVLRSQQVMAAAAKTLGNGTTVAELLDGTSVDFQPDALVLDLSYSADTAEEAQKGAEAIANAYLTDRETQAKNAVMNAVEFIQTQISNLRAEAAAASKTAEGAEPGSQEQIDATSKVTEANDEIAILLRNSSTINVLAIDPGEVLVPADLPSEPAVPNHPIDALRGLLIGLALGIAAAITIENARRRARTRA